MEGYGMSSLDTLLNELEEKAKSATPKWFSHERNPQSIMREYEIVQAGGGILFRSTSYGRMREDAEYIAACRPDVILDLIGKLRVAVEALEITLTYGLAPHDVSGSAEWKRAQKIRAVLKAIGGVEWP